MKASVALSCVAAVMVATPAMASDWRYITTGSTQTATYVDVESIRISGDDDGPYRLAWIKRDHTNDTTTKDRETKALYKFRCETMETGALAITSYDPRGRVTFSDNIRDPEFRPVIPDTVQYYTLNFVCAQ